MAVARVVTHSVIHSESLSQTVPVPTIWDWIADKVAGPLIAGLGIVIIGSWLIARANDRYHARREFLFSSTTALRDRLREIPALAASYWLAELWIGVQQGPP